MANLPRIGRTRQRPSAVAPPLLAAVQPTAEPKPEISPFAPTSIQTQPIEPTTPAPASPLRQSPRLITSPPKKATSPFASPKYGDSLTRVDSPPAAKATRSPPDSPTNKYLETRNGETTPPLSPAKSRRTKTPPLSPLTLPRTPVISWDETTALPRTQPVVETKGIVYNKAVEKPTKTDRPSEYGSGKPHQKQQATAEVINLNGHNVGAVMEINKSSDGYRLGGETVKNKETKGGGVHHGHKEKNKGAKIVPPVTAFMNTNFQSINNSILYDSSCNHHDPGLHLSLPESVDGDGATVYGHKSYKPNRQ
ncbi:proline-rich receptor-like protein kinase PERK8 [Benincasa hispida]|uniref:proline-rich receptor-like protein kinase PERK8 n=1 Tax=Benincasa hispida TaxID=102211 RepID=UPI001900E54E|nr:proline-rich receptor-like protein kinase PERK8 [Benincasa hispida]